MMNTIMHTINYTMVSGLFGLGLGWYLRGRGWTGVENDLVNIKNDLVVVKNHIFGTPAPVVVSAPAVVTA